MTVKLIQMVGGRKESPLKFKLFAVIALVSCHWDKIPSTHNLNEERCISQFLKLSVHSHLAPKQKSMVEGLV